MRDARLWRAAWEHDQGGAEGARLVDLAVKHLTEIWS
jgi:hypothetical protein